MKILIFGSGVIGSIYGARLHQAHYNVTLLARGKRHEDLSRNGITIKDALTGEIATCTIPLIKELGPADFYDLIIVTVRFDQLDAVLPVLKGNSICPLIMFMLNCPDDIDRLIDKANARPVILGFPGIGGIYRENFIEYITIKQQKTTIGQANGNNADCIDKVKEIFGNAHFEVETCSDMQAWLKTHAIFISCFSAAINRENGDSIQLAKNRGGVDLMVRSIREGFSACKALGLPIEPTNLKTIFMTMPRWFSVLYWQIALKGKIGTLAMAPHANVAKDEMKLLARKVLTLAHSSSLLTPNLDKLLLSFI